ncbi:MAG: iron-containing alcohol dehydrogenase family protein [Spirochaetota bacterium]
MSIFGMKSTLRIPETVIYGSNTVEELGTHTLKFGKRAVLIYGGKSLHKSGNYQRVLRSLKAENIDIHEISGIVHDPDELLVKEVSERVRELSPTVIIGVGGGSVIDVAKAAAIISTNGGAVKDYWGGREFLKPSIPCIAVPTTSGTGSEVTNNAVITSADKLFKKSIRSQFMVPKVALVDPTLTLSLPTAITADTGLDALIQNLEAYTSKNSGPITDLFARKGIELAGMYLLKACQNSDDLEAREAMSLVSLYGGITLVNAGLGLAHGLSHPLGIRFGIPHGKACAIVMSKVIEFNYPSRKEKYEEIGMLLGGVKDAVRAFNELLNKLGISTKLSDYGVKREDIPFIVEHSKGGSRNYNPVDHTDETVAKMLEELL